MHHYPHHIGDYRTHTAHLTMVEDGAYRRLLDLYYMHEKPLPADVAGVQRLASARTEDERAAVETVLREFFRLQDDGWHQVRADEEIEGYQARASKARENGQRGGRPKTQDKPSDNQPGSFSDTQTEPNEKLTVNREPITIKGAKAPTARRSSDDDRFKLPTDWRPTVDDRNHASDKGLDPETVTAAFLDYFCEGRGRGEKRTLDGWSKRFRIWCNTDAERKPVARSGSGFRSPVDGGDVGAFARAARRLGGEKLV
jgi:uncharacterized protein YdaU (DUF1376 family)